MSEFPKFLEREEDRKYLSKDMLALVKKYHTDDFNYAEKKKKFLKALAKKAKISIEDASLNFDILVIRKLIKEKIPETIRELRELRMEEAEGNGMFEREEEEFAIEFEIKEKLNYLNKLVEELDIKIERIIDKGFKHEKITKCVYCGKRGKSGICSRCLDFLKEDKEITVSCIEILKSLEIKPKGYHELTNETNLSRERIRQIKKILMEKNLIRETAGEGMKFELNPKAEIIHAEDLVNKKFNLN